MRLHPDASEDLADNLLMALFHLQRWNEVLEKIHSVPASSSRQALAIAAIAARDGAAAAVADADRLDQRVVSRSEILVAAADCLIQIRQYHEGVALLNAALPGAADASKLRARIAMLQDVRPYDQVLLPVSDPRRLVQEYYLFLFNRLAQPADLNRILLFNPADQKNTSEQMVRAGQRLRAGFTRKQVPLIVARDVVLSDLQLSVEGDEATGFRIHLSRTPNGMETMLVASRDGQHLIVAVDSSVDMAGDEALRRLAANDSNGARLWLDWAREQVKSYSSDDPLAGSTFARFWNRGDRPDIARMRMAALSLLTTSSAIKPYLAELNAARGASTDPVTAVNIDLVLAQAAYRVQDWKLYHDASLRLLSAQPLSNVALGYVVSAAVYSHDWEMGQKAIQERLSRVPDDIRVIQQSAALAANRGQFARARSILRPLIENRRAGIAEINEYAWNGLFTGSVSESDVALMQEALIGSRNNSFEIIHTMAALYADTGKTKEARDLLLHGMDAQGLDEPNDAVWLVLGRIAEQYGLTNLALSLYQRVDDTPYSVPSSNFGLAQLWEKTVYTGAPTRAAMH